MKRASEEAAKVIRKREERAAVRAERQEGEGSGGGGGAHAVHAQNINPEEARKALAADPTWVGTYMKPMLPMLAGQKNVVMNAFPWCALTLPTTPGGVYELRQYTAKPGTLGGWEAAFQKVGPAMAATACLLRFTYLPTEWVAGFAVARAF